MDFAQHHRSHWGFLVIRSDLRFYSSVLAAVWERDGRWVAVGGGKSDSRETIWEARKIYHLKKKREKRTKGLHKWKVRGQAG